MSSGKLFRRNVCTCIRVVTKVENPNPWMMMVPKFEIPPFGMLHTTPRMKKK